MSLTENSNSHGKFKSFKLMTKKKDVQKVDDPSFWPCNVKVRQFFMQQNPREKPLTTSNQVRTGGELSSSVEIQNG